MILPEGKQSTALVKGNLRLESHIPDLLPISVPSAEIDFFFFFGGGDSKLIRHDLINSSTAVQSTDFWSVQNIVELLSSAQLTWFKNQIWAQREWDRGSWRQNVGLQLSSVLEIDYSIEYSDDSSINRIKHKFAELKPAPRQNHCSPSKILKW